MGRNQFFRISFKENRAFLHITAALDGGSLLRTSEVVDYLEGKSFKEFDKSELDQLIRANDETKELFIGSWDGIAINEMMTMRITLDKMQVVCRFYPPSENGGLMDKKEIIGDLVYRNIRFGIDQDKIDAFLENRTYCTDIVLAVGNPPVHGKDARIEYYFNTNINLQPKRNEDGSVNYKELNTINHIKEGDLLAKLIPEDVGTSGQNVYGEEIKPRTVKKARLEFGRNIEINEERTEIRSKVTGHVSIYNGKVFVSNVYEVPADIDNSTGNIEYEGSVHVCGNVKSGFSVKSKGDVVIDGLVESAQIEADGQIIIKRGVLGNHKGVLEAGSNVIAKYIENCTVIAGGYVEAEIFMSSDISAGGSIRAHGRKSLINGGILRAGDSVESERIGTEMGTITKLEVGMDPEKTKRYDELIKLIAKEEQNLEDMKAIIDNYGKLLNRGEHLPKDKLLYVQKLVLSYKQKKDELEPKRTELSQLRMEKMRVSHASISVDKEVYPGVEISIADKKYFVKEMLHNVTFRMQKGAIVNN